MPIFSRSMNAYTFLIIWAKFETAKLNKIILWFLILIVLDYA